MEIITIINDRFNFPLIESAHKNGYSVKFIKSKYGSSSYHAKIEKVCAYVSTLPDDRLILYADAFDTFVRHPFEILKERFLSKRATLMFSTEITKNHISEHAASWYQSQTFRENAYINTGLYIGKAFKVRQILNASRFHNKLYQGSKLRTDQTAIGETIFNFFEKGENFLDYDETLFYTAANKRWSISKAIHDMNEKDPVFIHFPFTQAPRVNNTFHALYDYHKGIYHKEHSFSICKNYEKLCKTNQTAHFCHVGPGHRKGMNKIIC